MFRSIFYMVVCSITLCAFPLHASARSSQTTRLSNGLCVTYISDPHLVDSAIGLEVQAGSWQDPKKYPGMAYLVGHLLGRGVTEAGRTCFSYVLHHEELKRVLKFIHLSFSQSFSSQDNLDKERAVLKQETSISKHSDKERQWRMLQLHAHPAHAFAQAQRPDDTTLSTLNLTLLSQWKQYYYRPEAMHLIVVSARPLEELEALVCDSFGQEKISKPQMLLPKELLTFSATDSFAQEHWQSQVSMFESTSSRYTLALAWEIAQDPHHSLLPLGSHLAGLLQEESKGSLYTEYAQKGWALSVASTVHPLPNGAFVLICEFELTPQGMRHDTDIIQGVMESLKRWRATEIPLYYLEQRHKQRALQAFLEGKPTAYQQVLKALRPEEMSLGLNEGTYSTSKWRALFAQLGPETMHVVKSAPAGGIKMVLDSLDPLTGVSYTTAPFSKRQRQKWVNAQSCHLERIPLLNPWIPERMPNGTTVDEMPPNIDLSQVIQGSKGTFYHSPLPRESMTGAWRVRWVNGSDLEPIDHFYRTLLIEALRIKGEERAKTAKRAGITTEIIEEERALCVEVSGYHECLGDYLNACIKDFIHLEISPEHFLQAKQRVSALLKKESAGEWSVKSLLDQAYQRQLKGTEQLIMLKNLTLEQFHPHALRLLRPKFVDVIAVSAPVGRDGEEWWTNLQRHLEPVMEVKEVEVKQSSHSAEVIKQPLALQLRAPKEGHRVVWILGAPKECHDSTLKLLIPYLRDSLFSTLHVEEKLVHALNLDLIEHRGRLLIVCSMESDYAEPQELLYRLERCIERFIEKQLFLSDEIDRARKKAIIKQLSIMPQNPLEACRYVNDALTSYQNDLKWKQHIAEQCAALSLIDYQTQVKSLLSHHNSARLSFLIQGNRGVSEQVNYRTVRSWKGLLREVERNSGPESPQKLNTRL